MAPEITLLSGTARVAADEHDGDWRAALISAVGEHPLTNESPHLAGGDAFNWKGAAWAIAAATCQAPERAAVQQWLKNSNEHGGYSEDEFRSYIGTERFNAHLNFFYGVTIERATILAKFIQLTKFVRSSGLVLQRASLQTRTFIDLYGIGARDLLAAFRLDRGPTASRGLSNQFVYWLFKHRLAHSEPAKVASDTKLGLELYQQRHPAQE